MNKRVFFSKTVKEDEKIDSKNFKSNRKFSSIITYFEQNEEYPQIKIDIYGIVSCTKIFMIKQLWQ